MVSILDVLQKSIVGFSLNEGMSLYTPLALFILGMVIYSFFIFKFYRFVARRDIFKIDNKKKEGKDKNLFLKFISWVVYVFKYIFFLPILIFFWFVVLSVILSFLSRQEGAQIVLLISIALIATIRIMSYYDENLSRDLAKMLPFALLGIFLVDISYFSVENSLNSISQIPGLWRVMVYYLVFLIILEFVLRIFFGIFKGFGKQIEEK